MIGLSPAEYDTGEVLTGVEEKSVWTLKAKYVSSHNTVRVVAVLFVYVL